MRRRKFSAGSPTSRLQVPMFRPIRYTNFHGQPHSAGNLRKKTGFTEFSTPDEYLRGFSKLLAATGTTLPPNQHLVKENGLLLVRAHRRNWTRLSKPSGS